MTPIRLLIVDDHALVRAGLRALIRGFPGVQIVGEAGNGLDALKFVRANPVDVVLMDLAMPGLSGLETAVQMASIAPDARILILSMHSDEEYVLQALHQGVAGYLLKDSSVAELEQAIHTVLQGSVFLTPAVTTLVAGYVRRMFNGGSDRNQLSRRQRQILTLIADGRGTKEIAALLGVSPKTVETHRAKLMEKLEIREVAGLVRYALENRLVPSGPAHSVPPRAGPGK